jgi:flagellar hook-length control protein FliK
MINFIAGNLGNLLDAIGRSGKASSIKAGTVLKAEVIDIAKDGNALLRLITPNADKGNMQQTIIKANSEIQLIKGQYVFLEVSGSKNNLKMRFIGDNQTSLKTLQQDIPAKLTDLLAKLSASKSSSSDLKALANLLKSMPGNIKSMNPGLKNLENLLMDTKQINSRLLANSARSLLTFTGRAEKALSIRPGTIVNAEVIKTTGEGTAVLRLSVPGSSSENIQSITVKTGLTVPLTKGQNMVLEVLGGRENIRMRFIGNAGAPTEVIQQNIPVRFLDMLAKLSDSRLSSSEFKLFMNMMKSLPQNIKTAIPEFKNLENLLSNTKQLDGNLLKAFIGSSGVAFETKLKIAVLSDPGSLFQSLFALQSEGDLKAALLKLKKMLKDQNILNSIKKAGLDPSTVSKNVEKFINNIEFFQLTSKVNDMFYTFLPLIWDSLKDGEFMFRKNREKSDDSYTCDINLDMETLGKLSISVTISDNAFYVSFYTERPEIEEFIKSQGHILEERFSSQGLSLKALNVGHKRSISFGEKQSRGVNLKI